MNKRKIIALISLALGVLCNPWLLGALFAPDGHVGAPDLVALIVLFELFALGFGLNCWFDWVKWQEQVLIGVSFVFMLFAFEGLLRTGLLDQAKTDTPLWFPEKFQAMNEKLNADKRPMQKEHEFGFSDINRERKRNADQKRIAILGDSFIHGDGIAVNDIWSHLLQQKFKKSGQNVEILTWGLSGWSTTNQLEFLTKHGKDFELDALVIGFVSNDPDMGKIKLNLLRWHLYLKPLKFIFRESINFIGSAVNSILRSFVLEDWGYHVWERKLYSAENLAHYEQQVSQLAELCKKQQWKLYVVFTPANHMSHHAEYFSKVEPIFHKYQIETLNLYPVVKAKLGAMPNRKLWANPANAHPGPPVTNLIADEVFKFLQRQPIASGPEAPVPIE